MSETLARVSDENTILLTLLRSYSPRSAAEALDVEAVISIAKAGNPWDRSLPLHATASALIVHPPSRRVLLRWHDRQQAWLQIGGHADAGEDDPLAVALREGAEEAGLADLRCWPTGMSLQHVAIVPVPASTDEPAHRHADLRFFLETDHPELAHPENPTATLRWLTPGDARRLTTEHNVREMICRAASLLD